MASILNAVAKSAVVLGATGSAIQMSIYNVDAGHRVVMFDRFRGVSSKVCNLRMIRVDTLTSVHVRLDRE